MIYITGDVHGEIDITKFNMKHFPAQKQMTKKDYVIIAGDFGCIWSGGKQDKYWLDWLESKNFTTLFVCGNHENFDLLNEYPVTEWSGGKVHQIRPSIYHLMRGQVFMIDGLKIFTFGGATSVDKKYRKEFTSWWKEEVPSQAEFDEGMKNLKNHNMTVDIVITHTAPTEVIEKLFLDLDKINDPTNIMLNQFKEKINFKQWFFGHFHENKTMGKFTVLYNSFIDIKNNKEYYCNESVYVDAICATMDCPRNFKCKRYAAYLYLVDNDIDGETCSLFPHKDCSKFIPMEED